MIAYVEVVQGRLIFRAITPVASFSDEARIESTLSLPAKATAREIAEILSKAQVEQVFCSSSCDFPEEYGGPEDLKQILLDALELARQRRSN